MGLRRDVCMRWLSVVAFAAALGGCGHVKRAAPRPGGMGGSASGAGNAGGSAAGGNADGGEAAGGDAAGSGGAKSVCVDGAALAKARIWLLTDQQYLNAVRQLFGVTVDPVITAPDALQANFVNFPELGVVTDDRAAYYQQTAKDVARQAVSSHYPSFMPCGDGEACAQQFIENRIARAFERRLDEKEVARYLALFRKGNARSPQDGLRLMIEATLQSPSFLYRSELGPPTSGGPHGQVALTPQQIASLLALSFTNALPDDELWQKADSGALAEPQVLAAEVERLLALSQTQANLAELAGYWLGLPRLQSAPKDSLLFPEFTPELRESLRQSAQSFAADLVKSGKVDDVVASGRMYLNASLAALYGVAGVSGNELRSLDVALPERSHGILSQPAVLAAFAGPTRSDPIRRGLFLRRALLCEPDVPVSAPGSLEVAATFPKDATERQLAQLRSDDPSCATCHVLVDPLGLLSERYDAIGRYSESDAAGPIDDSATLSMLGADLDGPTHGLGGLSDKLRGGRRLSDCVVQNLSAMTLGRQDLARDQSCALQTIKDALASSRKFSDFYRALATSPAFVKRDTP